MLRGRRDAGPKSPFAPRKTTTGRPHRSVPEVRNVIEKPADLKWRPRVFAPKGQPQRGVKPLPRLHFGLVWDVSSLTARSIERIYDKSMPDHYGRSACKTASTRCVLPPRRNATATESPRCFMRMI